MKLSEPLPMKGKYTFQNNAFPKSPGLYFIFFEDRIVYIGRTNNIQIRLASHSSNFYYKEGMKAAYIIVETEEERRRLEKEYIKTFKPELNGKMCYGVQGGVFMDPYKDNKEFQELFTKDIINKMRRQAK